MAGLGIRNLISSFIVENFFSLNLWGRQHIRHMMYFSISTIHFYHTYTQSSVITVLEVMVDLIFSFSYAAFSYWGPGLKMDWPDVLTINILGRLGALSVWYYFLLAFNYKIYIPSELQVNKIKERIIKDKF